MVLMVVMYREVDIYYYSVRLSLWEFSHGARGHRHRTLREKRGNKEEENKKKRKKPKGLKVTSGSSCVTPGQLSSTMN